MANDIVSGSVSALAGMGTSNAAQAASAKKSKRVGEKKK